MRTRLARPMLVLVVTLMLSMSFAPTANAATSDSAVYWNDQPMAKAWFNSGWTNPSKGPNSFTLKAEEGASEAALWYQVDGDEPVVRTVYGSGTEVTFSLEPSPTTLRGVTYGVCGVYWGHSDCVADRKHAA